MTTLVASSMGEDPGSGEVTATSVRVTEQGRVSRLVERRKVENVREPEFAPEVV